MAAKTLHPRSVNLRQDPGSEGATEPFSFLPSCETPVHRDILSSVVATRTHRTPCPLLAYCETCFANCRPPVIKALMVRAPRLQSDSASSYLATSPLRKATSKGCPFGLASCARAPQFSRYSGAIDERRHEIKAQSCAHS